jgi:PhnB protein
MKPDGWHSITPRIVVSDPPGLISFIKRVFDASGEFEPTRPSLISIGDSSVMISRSEQRDVFPAFLYVYVDDVDLIYQRAVDAGAESMEAVWDTPYGDRRGMFRDGWGNIWQVATPKN